LPKVLHERGYLIPAININGVDYEACARQLADSIKHFHTDAHVTILTEDMLPFGNLGGYANDWQCFHASPYRQTIKLEADMIAAGPVDHWWTLFERRDVVISQGARDFYDRPAKSRQYRRVFDANQLPDVYNAVTYWRLSTSAQEFFSLVKSIFANWAEWKQLLKYPEDEPSTDVVYAIAAVVMGPEQVTLPPGVGPTIVHMKQGIVPIHSRDWTQELVWEADPFRIQTVAQWGFVHYHNKQWRLHRECS
jgi:hypothetical protein